MSLYRQSVVQMSAMLRNLDVCLDKAVAFAEARESSPDSFVSFRLSPDMKPFSFQVQTACDMAKFAAARLADIEPPKHPDEESTMAELKQRIASTLEFLGGVEEARFASAAEREIRLSFLPGKAIKGVDYLREFCLPNFYFHVTTAYDLLRMSGVVLSKRDFLGTHMALYDVAD